MPIHVLLRVSAPLCFCSLLCLFASLATAQRLAIITPENSELSNKIADLLVGDLSGDVKVLDREMAAAAFGALHIETPFNMTVGDARRAADAIGGDFLLLVKAGSVPRTSLSRGEYFEAFALVYLVSARSGRLVYWKLSSFEDEDGVKAERLLVASIRELARSTASRLKSASAAELAEKPAPAIEQLSLDYSPDDKSLRPPVPYRRIKPQYTDIARLYGVAAIVEVEADIEADGRVSRTEVSRWGGFGLDSAAVEAVQSMNWRPAERGGKPLAMRVLLRYNFTRIEK